MFQPCAINSFRNSLAQGGGRLEGSYVLPKQVRVLRGLARYRVRLVKHQSAVACRIQKLLERCNIKLPSVASDILGVRYGLRCMASADGWCPESRATPAPADVGGSTFQDVRQGIACHHQKGRTFSNSRLLLHDPSKPGASASRICSRARHSLVFTFASERPRTFAVSLILRCCTSRKIITTRYFPARESRALVSAFRSSTCSKASDGISRQSAKSFGM